MTAIDSWGSHWHGLRGARVINTEAMLRARRHIEAVLKHQGIVHIYGPAGSGKTFAVARALAGCGRPVVYALFDGQANPREMASVLLKEATGCDHDGTRFTLRDACVSIFKSPIVIVIDEAQHLQRDCMYFLRYMHDQPVTNVTIVLAGGAESRERVQSEKALASRARDCPFHAIKLDVLLRAIPRYHPIWASVEPTDIQRIYECYAGGDLRRWAEFTVTCIDECTRRGARTLEGATLDAVLAELAPHGS